MRMQLFWTLFSPARDSAPVGGGKKGEFRDWTNINRDIEELAKSCPPCQRHQKVNVKETLLSYDMPQKTWHTRDSDIFHWNNANYL